MPEMAVELTGRDLLRGMQNVTILREIRERHQHAKIQVAGRSVAVDMQTANVLIMVYDALGLEAQAKFAGMLHHSPGTFRRLVDFSWGQVK
ncbi:hypothetical protein LCGC14_0938790 [marine sediment metagenome]|uniref:Uncharacterized protein n=1 Tax=marine sediment metagenome TaxID=412755 RepID=A0A0F9R4B5_9ZZZZ